MELSVLKETYSVVKLPPTLPIPLWALEPSELFSICGTKEELSIVCPTRNMPKKPQDITVENNWRCIKVEGTLDFSLTGILSSLAAPLAQNGISIFAISTYNTDYLLVKEDTLEQTISVLQQEGNRFINL